MIVSYQFFMYSVYAIFIIAVVACGWWFYSARLKRGFMGVLTEKSFGGCPEEVARREFHARDSEVKLLGESYTVDLSKPAYRRFGWTYYFYDKGASSKSAGALMTFGGNYQLVSPAERDKFLNRGLWSRIMSLVNAPLSQGLVMVVIIFVILSVVAGVLGYSVYPMVHPLGNSTVYTGKVVFGL